MILVDRPDDLKEDAKRFVESEYGKYIVEILEEKQTGYLTMAANTEIAYPERYAAKYSAIKEVLNLLYSPLDDHTPPRG